MSYHGAEVKTNGDVKRLIRQTDQIVEHMIDGKWRTLDEISVATGIPQASASAQLRNLRKPENGRYRINRRARGDRTRGLFEYQLLRPILFQFDDNGQGLMV